MPVEAPDISTALPARSGIVSFACVSALMAEDLPWGRAAPGGSRGLRRTGLQRERSWQQARPEALAPLGAIGVDRRSASRRAPGRRPSQASGGYNSLFNRPQAFSSVSCWALPGVIQVNQVLSPTTPSAVPPDQVCKALTA